MNDNKYIITITTEKTLDREEIDMLEEYVSSALVMGMEEINKTDQEEALGMKHLHIVAKYEESESPCPRCEHYEKDYPTICGLRFLFEYEETYCVHDQELPDKFEPKEKGN